MKPFKPAYITTAEDSADTDISGCDTWQCSHCGAMNRYPNAFTARRVIPVCDICRKLHPQVDACFELAATCEALRITETRELGMQPDTTRCN